MFSLDSIVFKPTNLVPINIESYKDQQGNYTAPYIEGFPTPLTDQKFAHLPHFSFLPPVNKSDSDLGGRQLGLYPNFNQAEILEYAALKETLESALLHEITFSTTSRDNNILIQPFEFHTSDGIIKKMDIIDFGTFPNSAGTSAQLRVFFVGKLTQDPVTTAWRFMNVFTLELDV